jgi:GWxTD domain-containing protein
MNLKVTLILTLILTYSGVSAQMSISEINLAHQFQGEKDYDVQMYGLKDDKQVIIFTSYQLPDSSSTLAVSFWGANTYEQPVRRIDSLLQEEKYLGKQNNRYYYQYIINTGFPLIALELVTGEKTSEIYDLYFDDQKLDVALFESKNDLPVMERWVNQNTSYHATDLDPQDLELYITHFPYNFESAAPPMSTKEVSEKELQKDSSYLTFDGTDMMFDKEGYYLFQSDTTSRKGFGWGMYNDAFPKYNQVQQLIPPLKYITTPDEFEKISEEMSKKAFDNFWLKIGRRPQTARSMISKYYSRVEEANRLFTSYKEGWKTDKGMIYIIYGPPHQVKRTENDETWWYFDGEATRQVFQFLQFSHVFYPYNYVLLRDEKYRRSWFTAVDLIRNNQY